MTELEKRLAVTVLMLTYDAHPAYSNTAGPGGGIGGQAITPWCNVINAYHREDGFWEVGVHTADAREVIREMKPAEYTALREELLTEWREEIA